MTQFPQDSTATGSGESLESLLDEVALVQFSQLRSEEARNKVIALVADLRAEIERLKDFTHWPDCLCAKCEEGV